MKQKSLMGMLGMVCLLLSQQVYADKLEQNLKQLKHQLTLPARLQLVAEARSAVQNFEWQQQPAALQQQLAELAQRYPQPKYQLYAAQIQTVLPLEGMRFELNTWHKLTPKPEQNMTVWDMRTLAYIGEEEFKGGMQGVFHPHLGLVQTWWDNNESTKWTQVQSQQITLRLKDGSLPAKYQENVLTKERRPFQTEKLVNSSSRCQAGKVYSGHTLHAQIKGKAQNVVCRYQNDDGSPETRVDMVYLIDYRVFLPTWEHFTEQKWQWKIIDFQGS